ncbi:hypothetical protein GE061_003945 [Apolygus lucorum]|uniref:Uncharacterized protein n=1 Tax=Apolygus lucorum TaxID=248454 RepID=A0A8S9WZ92_APOLU|nr:hypothetical protein GE061_003945 [Apolygus lucorum]
MSTRSHSLEVVGASGSSVPLESDLPSSMHQVLPITSQPRSPVALPESQQSTELMAVTSSLQGMMGTMQQMQQLMLQQLTQLMEGNSSKIVYCPNNLNKQQATFMSSL